MRRFTHTFPRRISAFLLCLALLVGLLPVTALAATVEDITYLDESGTQQTAASATQVTNSDTQWTNGWYVAQGDITIDQPVTVSDNVYLILEDGCNLNVSDGIVVETGNSLTIYAQSTEDSMGKLTATRSDPYGAGIGGVFNGSGGTVTINGGTVIATGGDYGAGIGGGDGGSGGTVTINGGTVTATGGSNGAGIGGGDGGSGGTVTINGGTVTATGNGGGAGIGGGAIGSGGKVTINGGTVEATGGSRGAGIGGGGGASDDLSGAGGTVAIYGGTVTATGGDYGAGIGGGAVLNSTGSISGAAGGQVTISGGRVKATGGNGGGAGIGGGGNDGGTPGGRGTFSTGQSGNAVIFANSIADNDDTSGWRGVIFQGNEGQVYGNVTLQEDLEIKSDETLTIGKDASLTVPDGKTLTNNGTIIVEAGGKLEGTINGNQPPKITTERLNDGTVNTKYNQTLVASGDATITWSSSDLPKWLTLYNNGTISGTPTTANTYKFTVTATNASGSDSKELTLTINPAPVLVTSVTLKPTSLSLFTGDTATLTAKVQPENATNQAVTWTSSNPSVATVENGVVTAVSAGTATITAAAADGSGKSATCAVTVEKPYTPPPYIPPSKPNWTSVARKLANAQPGDTVTVKMNGETEVPGEVWETIAGRDVTVILDMGGDVSWTVDGNDVPTATHFADMDFGVDRNTTGIDVDVINAITGQVSSVQITLAHDGEFGFTLTLTAPLGRENAGNWANLYHYDEDAKTLNYETSAEIQKDGTARLRMTHASQYAIIIDDQAHQLPFEDVTSGAWYEGAVRYAYLHDIMEGMSATTFQPNGTLSRAMAVQIFYNLEGKPDISGENLGYPYEDVNAQAWYGDAVYWARLTGVATGYGDGTFQPGDSITRQEFAQMLYNYAKYKGCDLTAEGDLTAFPDGDSVQDWAETAMSWANGNELINGHDDGTLEPGGTTTRAQAAAVLMRFDQDLAE